MKINDLHRSCTSTFRLALYNKKCGPYTHKYGILQTMGYVQHNYATIHNSMELILIFQLTPQCGRKNAACHDAITTHHGVQSNAYILHCLTFFPVYRIYWSYHILTEGALYRKLQTLMVTTSWWAVLGTSSCGVTEAWRTALRNLKATFIELYESFNIMLFAIFVLIILVETWC